jgi:hypothetical protein
VTLTVGGAGPAAPAITPRPDSSTAPGAAAGRHRPATLGHDALAPRHRPTHGLSVDASRVGASPLPMARPGAAGRMAAHATASGDAPEEKKPFDFSSLDFPMVFPMQPIDPVNPARVPHTPPPEGAKFEKTVPMLQAYQHEEKGMVFGQKVRYLDETERQAYEVNVKDGLLHGADGQPFDTRDATVSGEKTGSAIFVMDHDGKLYLSNQAGIADFQHTSFLAGQPVAAAGTIRVEDGVIKEITRSSGHYRPAPDFLDQAVAELHARGVPPGFVVSKDV